ncbi:hypothetical protein ACFSHQ_18155 [Gemmobacter lanyuensis]
MVEAMALQPAFAFRGSRPAPDQVFTAPVQLVAVVVGIGAVRHGQIHLWQRGAVNVARGAGPAVV